MDLVLTGTDIGKILLSAGLGAIVGIERDLRGRPAGVRTNMIIAVSSCLFTMLSLVAFPGSDTSRIAAQIVTGVGFLGAGALIHSHDQVHGLTSAADIWLVAAIGMSVGAGAYGLATFVAIVTAVALVLLTPISRWLENCSKKSHR
jgi:putative Mg2+ transporter-C (MgtC) family protein